MTSAALHHPRPLVAAPAAVAFSPDEIEAWFYEVGPLVKALAPLGANLSSGRRRWLATQVRFGAQALVALEADLFEAEAHEAPTHDLLWLHTRVAALVEAARPRPALTAAA
ncbi:hypothetical protein KSP35_14685 [Aquihabitans sp. G128]|uniref:hypothetical protein n=1 Tax=Aquihabitans sp. G128 TaxID=2849779 RepID=UPI001C23BA17|nr:hypothetical protein [Aquihabitans sp. G128]QXC59627.1 hypothetical protein KSP35_14685 [Aquihabitans sp. G128]